MANVTPLLEVHQLVKCYGSRRAVDHVSFHIDPGETLALVGESGCGKTTLARCIVRLLQEDAGYIRFAGKEILQRHGRRLRELRQHLQMVFQDPFSSLNPRRTAGQAIAEPLLVHRRVRGPRLRNRVIELLELVGLRDEHAQHYPHEFSGGQRQRIAIARALALEPQLIVADEPVSALDVSVQAQILNLLQDLQEKLGLTYLFISHNLPVVRHLAERTAVMQSGRIVELAATEELFQRPQHSYTQALLAAIPAPSPPVDQIN
jgi:oligopeptide transport system ATP-binding protein